eukprot:comp11829_c0_seq2/m.6458 comp11829_c0_seq2/g.6458  ORF comp11829_c0_seq2/g.6458 comp11829_c0_seq2/m.6458 type:complete len:103 (-) comp11829_c0_seq2:82-390(-)
MASPVLSLYRECVRLVPQYAASEVVRTFFRTDLLKTLKLKSTSKEHIQKILDDFDTNQKLVERLVRLHLKSQFRASPQDATEELLSKGCTQLEEVKRKLAAK